MNENKKLRNELKFLKELLPEKNPIKSYFPKISKKQQPWDNSVIIIEEKKRKVKKSLPRESPRNSSRLVSISERTRARPKRTH